MKLDFINATVEQFQEAMYVELNDFSAQGHSRIALVIPVVLTTLADAFLETVKFPLAIIEYLALTVINLIGTLFSEKYSLKDTLYNMDQCLTNAANTPVALCMFIFKFVFQLCVSFKDPEVIESINRLRYHPTV